MTSARRWLRVALCAALAVAAAAACAGGAAAAARGGGESQIDESAPDDSGAAAGRPGGAASLPERLREYAEGSLARYDALKCESAGLRRQGWFPSLFLDDAARDVDVAPAASGDGLVATVNVSYARRDCERRLVIAPAGRFELPGADRRFLAELLGALAQFAPEISRARLVIWFATLRSDGEVAWESRGSIGVGAAAARRLAPGQRTPEALWPLLDENTLPASVWGP